MVILKITLGVLLLLAAWGYLFQKKLIFKLNAWMREVIFSDQVALFSGRRVAILLLVLGAIALFSGLESFIKPPILQPHIQAQMLEQARQDLANKRHFSVIQRCRYVVKANPDSQEAWELLIETYARMGEKEMARQTAGVLLRLDPQNGIAKMVDRGQWEKVQKELR